ncbi:Annexin [Ascobolus immersus RN42]|uniref:Annexin n=1 Tax=Ascobolus immersus RN42 TaxID=1160509 RepID=A0A3N4IJ55_ASCIM|nr:Annexin [Ascobolus immersus RN42]
MANIKKAYKLRYGSSLERALKGDLSGKTEKLFVMAIEECRQEDWIQPDPNRIAMDVKLLRKAGEGVIGTDEITFAQVFTRSNDAHLRAVAQEYERTYGNSLRKVIDSEFSGHLKQAFSYILEGALNKAERDARLLEDSMKGFGTKDTLLISRLIRVHWDQGHLEAVKRAYFQL